MCPQGHNGLIIKGVINPIDEGLKRLTTSYHAYAERLVVWCSLVFIRYMTIKDTCLYDQCSIFPQWALLKLHIDEGAEVPNHVIS